MFCYKRSKEYSLVLNYLKFHLNNSTSMQIKFRSNSKKKMHARTKELERSNLSEEEPVSFSGNFHYHIVIGKIAIVHRRHRCKNLFSELFRCSHKILSKVFSKECTGHSSHSENLSGLNYRLQNKYQHNCIPYIEVPGAWELDPGAETGKQHLSLMSWHFLTQC